MPLKDPIAAKEYAIKYRETRREKAKERSRKWREEHPEELKKMLQANYLKNREKRQTQIREYNKTEKGREVQRKSFKKARELNPEKYKARQLFKAALYCGKIQRQPCQYPNCNDPKVQGHHKDYSRPYEVEWFCMYHHKLIEGKILVPRPEPPSQAKVKIVGMS